MMMGAYHPLTHMRTAEAMLPTLTNPHHRAILENYRYHALLEVAGRWQEILAPALTIDHPIYRISAGGVTHVMDGGDAVARFYSQMKDAGRNVFGPVEQTIAVADWGFGAEALFQAHATGAELRAQGKDAELGKAYRIEWWASSAWHYTPDARLIGENVYEGMGPRTITECDPAEIITPAEAAAMLEPVLAKGLSSWR